MPTKRRRIVDVLAVTAILLAAALAVRRGCAGRGPASPAHRLLSDDTGRIEHVACLVNSSRKSPLRNAELVSRIVNALPPRVHVTIMTNDRARLIVPDNIYPRRVDYLDLPADSRLTIWPQDPFLVLTSPEAPSLLLASSDFERGDDRLIAEGLAERLGWPYKAGELAFEGGNIVCGSRHAFIGAETVARNVVKLGISKADVARKFEQELGRQVLVLGSLPQPVAHLDMILTPLDANRLALADAGWGARLVKEQLEEDPKSVVDFERYCEQYYFGHPRLRSLSDDKGRTVTAPQVVGRAARAVEASHAIAEELDEMAKYLADLGYDVHRLPFLMPKPRAITAAATGPATQPAKPKPDYPYPTYNNVLTETFAGERIVYLPQYGLAAMDRAAAKAWGKLGYRVVPVGGLAISSMYGGSLRCCVKVLSRTPPDSR